MASTASGGSSRGDTASAARTGHALRLESPPVPPPGAWEEDGKEDKVGKPGAAAGVAYAMADEQPSTSTPLSTDNHTYGTDAPNAPLLAPGASGRKSGTRHGSSVPVSSPSGLHAYDVTDSVREGAGAVAGGDDDGPDYGDPKVRLRRLEQLGLNREVLERGTPFMCGSVRGFVILCIALTALTCILLGYDIGVLSGAKIYIQRDFKLEDSQVELLVGILNFVSSVGGLFSGRLSDWIGRKKTVALACVIFLAGAAAMAAAPSYEVLMVGRIITGVGVGTGLTIAPLYMAELSPKRIRGALVSMNEVAINVGILLGFVAGYAFSGLSDNVSWRWMLGVGAVPPVIILLSLLIMPESPRWLVRHGRPEQALLVLLKTCDMTEAFETLAVLEDECLNTEEGSLRDIFFPDKSLRRLIIAGFGVTFFQQASGIEALVSAEGQRYMERKKWVQQEKEGRGTNKMD